MKLSLGLTPRDFSVAGGAVAYDTDAQAYFTANTAITSTADKNAINDFYLGLKSDGIYTKLKAMYLWKWGSASSDKWNMINPLDTDPAFRCYFANGFTYSTSGITGNGTSAYIDTFLNPTTTLSLNDISYGFYSRTARVGNTSRALGAGATLNMQLRTSVNNCQIYLNSGSPTFSLTDTRGFFQGSRINSTNINYGKNTYNVGSLTSTTIPNFKFYFFAYNNAGTVAGYDTIQSPFGYIGQGLTLTELQNFYIIVNTLMTYFGINV